MKTMKQLLEDVKRILSETPEINDHYDRSTYEKDVVPIMMKKIDTVKDSESKIEDGIYHNIDDDGSMLYKRNPSGDVTAYSIEKNGHHWNSWRSDKETPGVAKALLLKHVDILGSLKSDDSHTESSRNMWMSLIKNNSDTHNFHYTKDKSSPEVKLTPENINEHQFTIWDTKKAQKAILKISKK